MTTKLTPKGKAAVASGGIAALVALGTIYIPSVEGTELQPYKDGVGVATVCSGETRIIMRNYTADECAQITGNMIVEFGKSVQSNTPHIEDNKWSWLAFTSFAINTGKQRYTKSTMRKLWNQGQYIAACRYLLNYKYAGHKVIQGLYWRRAGHLEKIGEYELCLVDAVPLQFGAK